MRIAVMTLALCTWTVASDAFAWGALAVASRTGPSDPAWGYSYRFGSQAQAERRALEECRKRPNSTSCEIKLSLGSGCGAVGFREVRQTLPDGKLGFITQLNAGSGRSETEAVANFEKACRIDAEKYRDHGPSECKVLGLVCANRKPVQPTR